MKFDREQLKSEIDRVSAEWDMSGAFVVIKDGALVHEGIYGYEDRMELRPMHRDSKYILHSESAFLVGMCFFMLIDQGMLKFTDKLNRFIPEYRFADQIKLIHLLKSTSGISDYFYNHLMIDLNEDAHYLALPDYDRKRMELKTLNQNRHFEKVLSIVESCDLLYAPGTTGRGGSETNAVFLAEIVKRVTGMSVFEYLTEKVFSPLGMSHTVEGYESNAVSSTVIREKELVRSPLDYHVTGVFTTTLEDMEKLLVALAEKKILSEKMWDRVLKYDSSGDGMIFENANGFDCGNIAFLGFGFFFYFNHKTGISFASLVSEEQTFKNKAGEWHYYRRDSREVIEAAFTYPVNTKMVKLSKSNMWQALNLKVADDQQGFVLEAKSSIAMALMYKTKHAFVQMEGSRVIGLLVLEINKKKNYYNIDIILIDKRYQGRGYGKIMLNWAIERLKDEGAKELEIGVNRFNHAAKKIYLNAGFTPKAIYDGGMTLHMKME
ncbi:MAG TPA: hypothetical protein DCS67_05410 [Clostridiales bacterium UBA8960]|nr:hypothetical protein [Clostridiales bacterium UBA8960]